MTRIAREGAAFVVEGACRGEPLVQRAHSVVVAAPAPEAAAIVAGVAPEAGRALVTVEYAPVAVVASLYRRADVTHSLAGFGFLVPKVEHRAILGTLFSSSMFDGRAPGDMVLLTTFAGGRRNPEVAGMTDAGLADAVHAELSDLVGARAAPAWREVVRWPQAIPQYDLGHLERLRPVEAAEVANPGLWFCANYRGGVAVGDRIAKGDALAADVDAFVRRADADRAG